MAEVTEFFSLEGSPANPVVNPAPVRDLYGFPISPPFDELFLAYSRVWNEQEEEREAHWAAYLSTQAAIAGSGSFTDLADLCDYLQDAVTVARDEREGSPRREELDKLVQSGVPFTVRGRAWSVFLDTSVRKQKNYYAVSTLVHRQRASASVVQQHPAAGQRSDWRGRWQHARLRRGRSLRLSRIPNPAPLQPSTRRNREGARPPDHCRLRLTRHRHRPTPASLPTTRPVSPCVPSPFPLLPPPPLSASHRTWFSAAWAIWRTAAL